MTDDSLWRDACEALGAGQHVFVALVTAHTRHSPGTRGARLLLTADDTARGTIGGGVMEHRVLSVGRQWLATGGPARALRETLHHSKDAQGARSGLICAGRQENLLLLLTPDPHTRATLREHLARQREDRPGLLCVDQDAALSLRDGPPDPSVASVRVQADPHDPARWTYQEQSLAMQRVAIMGGGHCGLALSRQLAMLDYTITVCETRPELEHLRRNDAARYQLIVPDYKEAAAQITHPALTPLVVMTRDMQADIAALTGALREPFPFIGVMGSPAKIAKIREALSRAGFDDAALARLHAPVGLPIESDTPAQIAVSIAAQLLQLRQTIFPALRPEAL